MDNVHLIQLSSYERPTITEEKNQDWVGIGDNNDYYQSLIDAYMDSTTNNAVINGIVNQIYGKGLDATDSNRKPEQYAEMKKILKPKELRIFFLISASIFFSLISLREESAVDTKNPNIIVKTAVNIKVYLLLCITSHSLFYV